MSPGSRSTHAGDVCSTLTRKSSPLENRGVAKTEWVLLVKEKKRGQKDRRDRKRWRTSRIPNLFLAAAVQRLGWYRPICWDPPSYAESELMLPDVACTATPREVSPITYTSSRTHRYPLRLLMAVCNIHATGSVMRIPPRGRRAPTTTKSGALSTDAGREVTGRRCPRRGGT